MKPNRPSLIAAVMACCLALWMLASCGGGGSTVAGGVGSGGTGAGTVSGFGSVIVDDVRYDDTEASVSKETPDGTKTGATVLLGHQVRVDFEGSEKARSILIRPQLMGPVTQISDLATGQIQVNGQRVHILSGTDLAPLGKPTLLAGYTATSGIALSDEVEVHGFWYLNANGDTELVATRLEKLDSASTNLLLTGLLASPTPSCGIGLPGTSSCLILRLNASTNDANSGAWLQVTDSRCLGQLEFGEALQVTVARSNLAALIGSSSTAPVTALTCKRASLRASEVSGGVLKISGVPTEYDSEANTVRINGTQIALSSLTSAQVLAIQQNTYLAMNVAPGQDRLSSSSLQVRDLTSEASDASDTTGRVTRISGWLVNSGINWSASGGVAFTLRNVNIQAAYEVVDASCRQAASGVKVWVSVQGRISASVQGVTASSVTCSVSGARP